MTSVADGVELGAWRREGARVGEVLDALAELRRGQHRTATRTSVVNLVVLATSAAEGERACSTIHRLGGRHPGRTIVLVCDEGSGRAPGLDAEVLLREAEAEGQASWSEELTLRVRGPVLDHLDSLIEPLTLPDLPVVVWLVSRLVQPSDALLAAADAVLVDTKEAGGEEMLPGLANLIRRYTVIDLSWVRLRPWRELLAGLFDPAPLRPFLAGVQRAEVIGKPGPRYLLGGWLVSRLGLPRSSVDLRDASHMVLRLTAEHDGAVGTFTVERVEDKRLLRSSARVEGGPSRQDHRSLPDDSLPWSLAECLTHLERDRAYEQAQQAALAWQDGPP
ncbi:MAG: glucose-6-phosphate dehydrogenase assembly protein OpcA [Actinomycetota bacterium]|nr:glucose-6-phosphate dehydrogenase assembly protein OpcA [Actinomycetota bacterium]